MGAAAEIEALLAATDEADDALRGVVAVLAVQPGVTWAGIAFLEDGALTLGPSAGTEDAARRTRVPVAFHGDPVGELWVDGEPDASLVARVADAVSAHVLVGWDTGGDAWEP